MTVILSMNIASAADKAIEAKNTALVLYPAALAAVRHSHLKKPLSAITSTIIIIPVMKKTVSQFMPGRA